MAFPVAAGSPSYSGTFIPEIWSSKLQVKFYSATVFGEIANTEYEGEIKKHGDKVHIRTIPSLTIRDYTKGQQLQTEQPEAPILDMLIDKGKYFQFAAADVDKIQSDIRLIDMWSKDASMQMKIAVDTQILGSVYADADSFNVGATAGFRSQSYNLGATTTPISLTKANVLDYIVDLGVVLTEQNIPDEDRWIVLPAWACGLIKKSDLKDASLTGDGKSILRNGRIGMIDNFTIFSSNNLTPVLDTVYCYNIMAGHKSAISFASQLVNMEQLRNPNDFGDIVRGLHVYGFKTIKPQALAVLYATKG